MITAVILLYEGVDEFDFCGPFEVLSSCRRLVDGHWSDRHAFHVETVAEHAGLVHCAHNLKVQPDKTLSQVTEADIIIVPGGPGAQKTHISRAILDFLREFSEPAQVVASVCTGAFLLGQAGLIDRRRVATHPARAEALAKLYPKCHVALGERIVMDGPEKKLMTCAGISAGIDLALAIITRFEGKPTAALAAKRIEWPMPAHEYSIHA